jgi:hypothetical protein
MSEPEDTTPEETTPESEDVEVVAHSQDETIDDWCIFNLSAL